MRSFNQTKIICTIGPVSNDINVMRGLIIAGMDVMRMNFSHENQEKHLERLVKMRTLNEELGTHVAGLLDTKGPEIRTNSFKDGKVTIIKGTEVTVHMEEIIGDANKFSISYPYLYQDMEVNEKILIDDGYLSLTVKKIDKKKKVMITTADNTHTIKNRRGINVPGVKLQLDFISDKDKSDIIWGCKNDVDFIAASFVRRASDVLEIRKILKENNNEGIQIISKIENKEGVDNIDSIIDVSDGIMIARGDLGVEIPAEDVPVVQKYIIERCHNKGKTSVTATQMLESMITHPRPTRAEVSDVANAIYDGTDAIMLSGESAIGLYPKESVEVMGSIATKIESLVDRIVLIKRASKEENEEFIETSIALSVAHTAVQSEVELIVAPTTSGNTARLISKYRPNAKIVALTPTAKIARSLALHSGVEARVFDLGTKMEVLIDKSIQLAKDEYDCGPGCRIILTGGFPIGSPTNFFRIEDIK
ncbi:MAG: pyruvate kinase [Candidatus Izimaplasma sp.]|nr:pyruvate kinase [Candidatus Izimaplasma bacterium]